MPLPKPSFNKLVSHYPHSAGEIGAGGRIINNAAYEGVTCALRMSVALEGAIPGFLARFAGNRAVHLAGTPGHYRRMDFPYARSAERLANYLTAGYVGWNHRRLNSRADAFALATQGIIFWKVKPGSGSPNHIDMWDPLVRTLGQAGGRTMLWAPQENQVEYAWFWELVRGGEFSPMTVTHALQSG